MFGWIEKALLGIGGAVQKVVDSNSSGISTDKEETEKILKEMEELKAKGKSNPNKDPQ